MEVLKRISEYLKENKFFYFTTIDDNKPKCRPLAFHMLYNEKLYFGLGTFKDVYKQITKNPNVEVCVSNGEKFMRYYGEVVIENDDELVNKVLDLNPDLKKIYNEETGYKLALFYLKNATVEFRNGIGIEEKICL